MFQICPLEWAAAVLVRLVPLVVVWVVPAPRLVSLDQLPESAVQWALRCDHQWALQAVAVMVVAIRIAFTRRLVKFFWTLKNRNCPILSLFQ